MGLKRRWVMTVFLPTAVCIAVASAGFALYALMTLSAGRVYSAAFALCAGGALILAVWLLGSAYLRRLTDTLADLTAFARRISDGSFGLKTDAVGEDELGLLAGEINALSEEAARSGALQTEFISSVSHELRTPLTAITGWTETLSYDESLDEETRKKGLAIVLEEARRLTNMVEELLVFTRIEDGRFTVRIEKLDIEAELEEACFTCRELIKQEGIKLEYTPPEEPMPIIPGDPERLKQVILNILDNAAKHGGSGKRIVVDLDLEEDYQASGKDFVRIRVRDFGPGIPPDELGSVKLKFYRGSSKARGSGIGLAVCEEIVTMHGGVLDIENAGDGAGGCLVTVHLPI